MRTSHWMIGLRQFSEEPLHFILLEWHIDLNSGVAGNRGSDPRADRLHVQLLLFASELIEDLVDKVFHLRCIHACRRNLDGN